MAAIDGLLTDTSQRYIMKCRFDKKEVIKVACSFAEFAFYLTAHRNAALDFSFGIFHASGFVRCPRMTRCYFVKC